MSTSDILAQSQEKQSVESPLNRLPSIAVDVALATSVTANLSPSTHPDIAYLQYTYGSTSAPKGVMVSHENIVSNLSMMQRGLAITPDDVHVSWLPLFHDMGLVFGALLGLFAGNPVTIMRPVDFVRSPARWLQLMSELKGSFSGGPNFAYDLCARRIRDNTIDQLDLSHWRIATNGAEPVRLDTLKAFANKFEACGFQKNAFYPAYGMAEATLFISGQVDATGPHSISLNRDALKEQSVRPVAPDSENVFPLVECGHGRWGDQEILVVDPESHAELDVCNIGEIWLRGSHISKGYYHNQAATEQAFQAVTEQGKGPFFRTGDLGFFDKNHTLYVTGRRKDLIIVNGQNVYPQDIEQIAEKSHPGLVYNSSAAFSPESHSAEVVLVAEVTGPIAKLDASEHKKIAEQIADSVARETHMTLTECILIKNRTLPKTSSGKVQRQKARLLYSQGQLESLYHYRIQKSADDKMDPLTSEDQGQTEKVVQYCRYWIASKLKIQPEDVDPDRPLPSFGVDSLHFVDLVAGLKPLAQHPITDEQFYQASSINELVSLVIPDRAIAPQVAEKEYPDATLSDDNRCSQNSIVFPNFFKNREGL